MKKLRKTLFVIAAIMTLLWISGNNHLYLGLYDTYLQGRTKPAVDDPNLFPTRVIHASKLTAWPIAHNYNKATPSQKIIQTHQEINSLAFLVIRNDSLLFEKYYNGGAEKQLTNSFSMAKTFLSIIAGVAIKEGKLKIDAPINSYLPEYINPEDSALTVRELLNMTSGMNFDENYGNPFGFMARAYYGDDIKSLLLGYHLEKNPGSEWEYLGGNNLLLSLLLEKVLGKSVSEYAEEKIWKSLNTENDAQWILDHEDGNEKTFSGLYATARDFAKIGALYLHQGNWNGIQIIDTNYVTASLNPVNVPDEHGNLVSNYGYAWWLTEYEGLNVFYMQGILGQYVLCIPKKDLIIVRTGKKRMQKTNGKNPDDLFLWLAEGLRIAENN